MKVTRSAHDILSSSVFFAFQMQFWIDCQRQLHCQIGIETIRLLEWQALYLRREKCQVRQYIYKEMQDDLCLKSSDMLGSILYILLSWQKYNTLNQQDQINDREKNCILVSKILKNTDIRKKKILRSVDTLMTMRGVHWGGVLVGILRKHNNQNHIEKGLSYGYKLMHLNLPDLKLLRYCTLLLFLLLAQLQSA